MDISRIVASLLIVVLGGVALAGVPNTTAQRVQLEAGGGWAIPSSSVDMIGTATSGEFEGQQVSVAVDPKSGLHAYGSLGLQWRLSTNFDLEFRLRAQQVQMGGDASDITSALAGCQNGACPVSNDPEGRLRTGTFEGRLVLTSIGRFMPYFLVGLGVVRTTVDGVDVVVKQSDQTPEDIPIQFAKVAVTDAGGDVGFGTYYQLVENLRLVGELRATGSLPGAKENAVTSFPFTIGLSYGF